jgi:modulator of FtsH protease HflK
VPPVSFNTYNGGKGGGSGLDGLPKEFQEVIDMIRQNLRFILFGIGLVLAGLVGYSSFYTVQPSEEAVITRFGKYVRTTAPGLHFKLPLGMERATKVTTRLVIQKEFGFRSADSRSRSNTQIRGGQLARESQMLTGDLNVADVEWIVQYQISDPRKFLFQAQDPQQNIRDVSEAIMRRVVGDRVVNDVLTVGRVAIANDAQVLMQEVLDKYDLGIRIVTVKLQDVNPPSVVRPSFNEVNAAKQQQERVINQAEEAYNKVIPAARGQAEETVSQAEGYASAIVNRAEGDAERFVLTLKEYQRAPAVTKKRLYLETMEELYGRFNHLTIIDDKVKGVLPVFGDPTGRTQERALSKEGAK